jgi:hypothetical protein
MDDGCHKFVAELLVMFAFRKQLCIRHVAATRQQEAM